MFWTVADPPEPAKTQLMAPDSNPALDKGVTLPTNVAVCPSGFVTVTLASPAAWGGVTAVIVEGLTRVTPVAAVPSKLTFAPDTKFVPLRLTEVPPAARGREAGHVFLLGLASALADQRPVVTLVLDDLHLLTEPRTAR